MHTMALAAAPETSDRTDPETYRMEPNHVCPLCGGKSRVYWKAQSFHCCTSCGLRFRNPMPDASELAQLYDGSWLNPELHASETGDTDARLANQYVRRLAGTLGITRLDGLRILDFGAGRGAMALALRDFGANVWSVDPYGYENLLRRGLRAYRKLSETPDDVRFDGIVTIEVIEHIAPPWAALAELRKRLDPGGWMLVATPNPVSLAARMHRGRWREAGKPGHLAFFTTRSLTGLLSRAGFRRFQRLRWFVRYSDVGHRRLAHWMLQAMGLDGSLRFLAWA